MKNGGIEEINSNIKYAYKSDVDRLSDSINQMTIQMQDLSVDLAITINELKNIGEKLVGVQIRFDNNDKKIDLLMEAEKHRNWMWGLIKSSPKWALFVMLLLGIVGISLGSGSYKDILKYLVTVEKIRNGTY